MAADAFARIATVALRLRGVSRAAKNDGSPILRVAGRFLAGLASHPSAEPGSLVFRADSASRAAFLREAPVIFYLPNHYRRHGVLLARLALLDDGALRELLELSRRVTLAQQPGHVLGEVRQHDRRPRPPNRRQ